MARFRNETAYDGVITQAVRQFPKVPLGVVWAVIATESSFNPDAYLEEPGGDGSVGLMQIRLSTAKRLGYGDVRTKQGLFTPSVNIYWGTALLNELGGKLAADWPAVFSAYNGGIRPALGFGARVTHPTQVCLRKDPATGRCLETFTAQPGQFGNQRHVDRAMNQLAYYDAGRKGAGPIAPLVLAALAVGAMVFLRR